MFIDLTHFIEKYEDSFHEVLDLIPVPLFVKDIQGKYIACNKAYEDISGKTYLQLIGHTVYDLWPKQQADIFSAKDNELFDNPGEQEYEADISLSFDRKCIVRFHKATFQNKKGETIGLLGSIFDITDMKLMEEKLDFLGHHDHLTELPNRRQLAHDYELESKKAQRHNRKLALFFIDLNKFKQINDGLGHKIGDELLQFIAKKTNTLLRKNENIYRVGGDEFCILVPEFTNEGQLKVLANRVINGISSIHHFSGADIDISCSIGIAISPDNGKSLSEITALADKAMYMAKELETRDFCFV